MGEVIQIRDLQVARERAARRARNYHTIECALGVMRENLVWAAEQLKTAPTDAHPELLDRIEKLAATIRYGMLMLGAPGNGTATEDANRPS